MFSRSCRLLVACTFALIGLAGCTIFEPGGPTAARTIRAHSAFQVSDVVERVFVDDGYAPIQRAADGIVFERPASKTDRVLYGDWLTDDITQRVKVVIVPKGEERYRVRCTPFVVRDAHDVSFEDQHRRWQVWSPRYGSMLREVERQCLTLLEARSPVPVEE